MGTTEFTEGTLLDGRVFFRQPKQGYRSAIDPLLLQAVAVGSPTDLVLDAGIGAGAASLTLAARHQALSIIGVERDPLTADLTAHNIRTNGWQDRIHVIRADCRRLPFPGNRFDRVMTNPPFHDPVHHTPAGQDRARMANAQTGEDLQLWLGECLRALRPQGWFTLIHKADALPAIVAGLAGRLGDLHILPLLSKVGAAEAKRVIVTGRKASRGRARVLSPVVVHEDDGRYTKPVLAALRDGDPLIEID
ncbi:MAG: tRNA1(Val) (adenine(37)-N6)-methyltransferase [Geminicoccaceae bacterium]